MSDRRQFIQRALITSGIAAFSAKSGAIELLLKAKVQPSNGWEFYESFGQILFPIYSGSNGLTSKFVCYLMRGKGKYRECLAVGINAEEIQECDDAAIIEKVRKAISSQKPRIVNLDGGDLGLPEEI